MPKMYEGDSYYQMLFYSWTFTINSYKYVVLYELSKFIA